MATTQDYIEFVYKQIQGIGLIRYRKMFGEYMVYINEKPILLVCDNTVYIKMLDEIKQEMQNESIGTPYEGAKPHYILNIDNAEFSKKIILLLEPIIPLPKTKNNFINK